MPIKILTITFKADRLGMYPTLERKFIIKYDSVIQDILDSMSNLFIISHTIETKELKDYIEI